MILMTNSPADAVAVSGERRARGAAASVRVKLAASILVAVLLSAGAGCATQGPAKPADTPTPPHSEFLKALMRTNPLFAAYADRYPAQWQASAMRLEAHLKDAGLPMSAFKNISEPDKARARKLVMTSQLSRDISLRLAESKSKIPDAMLADLFALDRDKLVYLHKTSPAECAAALQGKPVRQTRLPTEILLRVRDMSARVIREANRGKRTTATRQQVRDTLDKVREQMAANYPDLKTATWPATDAQAAALPKRDCQYAIDRLTVIQNLPAAQRNGLYRSMLQTSAMISVARRWQTRVLLMPGSNTVLVAGNLGIGASERLRKLLAQSPAIDTVVLDSRGGVTSEGQELAALIRQGNLNTHVSHVCASACTIAFLAGRERTLARKARLGFHDSRQGDISLAERGVSLEFYRELYGGGLPDAFLTRIRNTVPTKMWYPSRRELKKAGVLTRSDAVAASVRARNVKHIADLFRAEQEKNPVLRAFGQAYPTFWKSEFKRLVSLIEVGAPDSILRLYFSDSVRKRSRTDRLAMPDGLAQRAIAVVGEKLAIYHQRAPAACVDAFAGRRLKPAQAQMQPADLLRRESQLLVTLLEQVKAAKRKKQSAAKLQRTLNTFVTDLRGQPAQWVRENLTRPTPPVSDAPACRALRAVVGQMAALEPAERGLVYRGMQAGMLKWADNGRYGDRIALPARSLH